MLVSQAKEIARQWVTEECEGLPDFLGAYLVGSVTQLPDDSELPASSDVDIAVVLAGSEPENKPTKFSWMDFSQLLPEPEQKPTKFLYKNALLEVNFPPWHEINSPEKVLGKYRRPDAFQTQNILSDPFGKLSPLFSTVSNEFPRRDWVRARCLNATNNTLSYLLFVDRVPLFHDQVTSWLFGTAGPCHMILTAGLQNPTIRRRYVETRKLLAEYGYLDLHEGLLELQGSFDFSKQQVETHLESVANVFDFAKNIIKTPYRFASDISDVGRPISIDGSRELIDNGYHREAVYWLVATYSRCMAILHNDATQDEQEKHAEGFHQLLADLGINSLADIELRSERVIRFLPAVKNLMETIMDANPAIED